MFTGIVEATGTIAAVEEYATTRRFTIESAELAKEVRPGDSVSVDGACLTVGEPTSDGFAVDVIGTTLERTTARGYDPGVEVNLERAATVGSRLDGHLVQGHVDGLARVQDVRADGEFWRLDVQLPLDVAATTVVHGSITLNGVSLTVSDFLADDVVQIGIIPFTWDHTNLRHAAAGAYLNVEADLIGKYVAKLVASRTP